MESAEPQSVGERIRTLRKRAGLSQEALANRLGTDRFRVIVWEKGTQHPGEEYAAKLARELGGQATDYWTPAGPTNAQMAALVPQLLESVEALQAEVLEMRKQLQSLAARREARGGGYPAGEAFSPPAEPGC